jgi:hypothetical protein
MVAEILNIQLNFGEVPMERNEATALLEVRRVLIEGHNRILDGGSVPDVAVCKQKDVAEVFNRAIKQLEEVLGESGQVSFENHQ